MDLELAARRLEAIGNPTRLRVILALARAGSSGLAVADVQRRVDVPASSTLSHHIRRLVEVGLVTQRRSGTTLICHAEDAALDEVLWMLAGRRGQAGKVLGDDVE